MPEVLLKNEVEKTMALHLVARRKLAQRVTQSKITFFINLKIKKCVILGHGAMDFLFLLHVLFCFLVFLSSVPAENKDAEIKRNKDIIRCEI